MIDGRWDAAHSQTPKDMAMLYSNVNRRAAAYRGFSASRCETRAQLRHRLMRVQVEPVRATPPLVAAECAPAKAATPVSPANLVEEKGDRGPVPPVAQGSAGSRWFALQGILRRAGESQEVAAIPHGLEGLAPVVAVFSVAGGVGKTSLAATLGRALAAHGDRVLLVDTTSLGLLPFHFGSYETKSGVLRTFSPPEGSPHAPVRAVTLDMEQTSFEEQSEEDPLLQALLDGGRDLDRILVDIQTASTAVARRLLPLAPDILAPLVPDMNSVASVSAVEAAFAGPVDSDGRRIEPIYILNQFDAALPLHVDVRETLRRQLGDRLLPFVVRRSPAVSEALAQGITVLDYDANSPVAEDYLRLAAWLRGRTSSAAGGFRGVRWTEDPPSRRAPRCGASSS